MSEQVMISRELLKVIEKTWRIHYMGGPVSTGLATEAIEKGLGQLRAILAAQSQPVSAQPAGEVVAVVAAAKALCKHHADICGVNSDDQWNVYSDDFIIDAKIVLEAIKRASIVGALQARAVVMPEPSFFWVAADEGSYGSPEEWAQDYYDYNGEKPESVTLSCAVELQARTYDSIEFDENGACISIRLVTDPDEFARLNGKGGV